MCKPDTHARTHTQKKKHSKRSPLTPTFMLYYTMLSFTQPNKHNAILKPLMFVCHCQSGLISSSPHFLSLGLILRQQISPRNISIYMSAGVLHLLFLNVYDIRLSVLCMCGHVHVEIRGQFPGIHGLLLPTPRLPASQEGKG